MEKHLRQGKASELVKGGVWYYKDEKGIFRRIVNDINHLGPVSKKEFSQFCTRCSKMGFMFINREFPNLSIAKEMHCIDKQRIKSYST